MSQYQAIIFDLDGVLILSAPAHEKAFAQTLSRFDRVKWNYAEIAGMRTDEAIAMIMKRAHIELEVEEMNELVALKRKLAREILAATKPVPADCPEVIQTLSERYQLGLATSASASQLEHFFEMVAVREFFKFVLSGDQVGKAKPHPEIYESCAQGMKVKPSRCLVVEDSVAGIQAATDAGMDVVWMDQHQFTLPSHLSVVGKIESLSELVARW